MHPHRSSALGYASAASAVHSRVYGACTAEAAASETSGLSVGGCPERWADFPVVFMNMKNLEYGRRYRRYIVGVDQSPRYSSEPDAMRARVQSIFRIYSKLSSKD